MIKHYIIIGLLVVMGAGWAFLVPLIRGTLNRSGSFNRLGWGTNRETEEKKEDNDK